MHVQICMKYYSKYLAILISILLFNSCDKKIISTKTGLQYRVLENGNGRKAEEGDQVYLFETTSYRDGTILYSNYNTGSPVKVLIGGKQATDAVDEGLRGMRAGEVRELFAPSYLVRRKSYPANVSPDSALVIKVKLDRIERDR